MHDVTKSLKSWMDCRFLHEVTWRKEAFLAVGSSLWGSWCLTWHWREISTSCVTDGQSDLQELGQHCKIWVVHLLDCTMLSLGPIQVSGISATQRCLDSISCCEKHVWEDEIQKRGNTRPNTLRFLFMFSSEVAWFGSYFKASCFFLLQKHFNT